MAFVYLMAIHCRDEWAAKCLADKYAGQTFVFSDARATLGDEVCRFSTSVAQAKGEWYAEIYPSHVTSQGIISSDEAFKANQFCNVMYGMLRNDAYFDFAIAAVECSEFRTVAELKEDLESGFAQKLDGLVISREFLAANGDPAYFVDFSDTHRWIPKTPERYPR